MFLGDRDVSGLQIYHCETLPEWLQIKMLVCPRRAGFPGGCQEVTACYELFTSWSPKHVNLFGNGLKWSTPNWMVSSPKDDHPWPVTFVSKPRWFPAQLWRKDGPLDVMGEIPRICHLGKYWNSMIDSDMSCRNPISIFDLHETEKFLMFAPFDLRYWWACPRTVPEILQNHGDYGRVTGWNRFVSGASSIWT